MRSGGPGIFCSRTPGISGKKYYLRAFGEIELKQRKMSDTMLKGILAISGQPGLSKLIAEAKNSIIVESLLTGKRMPVYSTSKVSALSDIAIFTESGEVNLQEVLKSIDEREGHQPVEVKESDIKAYFEQVLPDYDRNRVYVSDMKKVIQWYNILLKHDLLNFDAEAGAEGQETEG